MASPSYTYTLTNGSTADATQVMQNFTDILNGVTDGSKDLSINTLTVAGTATLNGAVNLGNATADDITFTGLVASDIVPKTDNTSSLGSSSKTWASAYFKGTVNTDTIAPSTSGAGVNITGATDGNSTGAGKRGEVLASGALGGAVTVTTSMTAVGSLSVTAGRWIIFGHLQMNGAGSTTVYITGCLGTTSASTTGTTVPYTQALGLANLIGVASCGPFISVVTISSTTSYYLNCSLNSGTQAAGAILGYIYALRIG